MMTTSVIEETTSRTHSSAAGCPHTSSRRYIQTRSPVCVTRYAMACACVMMARSISSVLLPSALATLRAFFDPPASIQSLTSHAASKSTGRPMQTHNTCIFSADVYKSHRIKAPPALDAIR